jgi:phosphatidylinositol alpha-1,6-mannosyltransferase
MTIIVSNVYSPDRGGIQTMMASLAMIAAKDPDGVIVVAPTFAGYAEFDRSVPYKTIRCPDVPRPFDAIAIGFAYLKALIVARDPITFAGNWWPTALPLAILPRRIRGKLAIFVHGSEVSPETSGIRLRVMRWIFSRADSVLANSAFTLDLLKRAGITKRVSVIPLGVDVLPIEPNRADEPTLLSVGRLVARKGQDKVIEAIGILRERFPTIRYEIVGEGPDRSRLEGLANELGLSRHVVFHGKLSQAAMRAAYARAWCFAMPVRQVGNDVEGFGIVYLEAAMAKLPTIGGRDSGAADAIEDGVTGFLVDGLDAAAAADAIRRIIEDPDRARRMGELGFERARRFTWERTFELCKLALSQ